MSALLARHTRALAQFTVRAALPALLLLVLALLSGLARTAGLGAFGLVAVFKAVVVCLDWLGECAPNPAYRLEVIG